jgi:hypothetical protein
MSTDREVLAIFADENQTVAAIEAVKQSAWKLERVHSPLPSHRIFEALEVKKSPVGWITLIGGILGFFTGFGLAIYTASVWKLVVWGKPIIALIPFVIVGFEFTILFSVFGNVLGLLVFGGLPEYQGLERYDPRCSGEHFGVVISCDQGEQDKVIEFFQKQGGEARVFEELAVDS